MERVIVLDASMGIIPRADVAARFPDVPVVLSTDVGADHASARKVFITANRFWDADVLDMLSEGDWVTTIGAGYDAFPVETFEHHGIAFTNSRGLNAPQVAEHAFALALASTRNLPTYVDQQREHDWEVRARGMTHLDGKPCTILGLGHIGEEVAVRATGFGMRVHGVKRDVDAYEGVADAVSPPEDLERAMRDAFLFVISVPHTDATEGMIGEAELGMLAEDAIVVNVARGPVVDTDGLLAALEADEIGSACLDVTDPEPLPAEHPLWDREDVLITPHCGGATDGYPELYLDYFEAQFDRWVRGAELDNRVV